MAFSEIIKIIALGAIAGFGGGFLWGVADRRGTEAAVDFADHHIRLPKNEDQAELVFSCGSSEPLVVYDLLTDEVLNKKWLIEKRLSSSLTRALDSDLFSHATASAAEGFGVMYSFKDELKAWKAHRAAWGHTLGVIGAVVIPTGLLGYLASYRRLLVTVGVRRQRLELAI